LAYNASNAMLVGRALHILKSYEVLSYTPVPPLKVAVFQATGFRSNN